METEANERRFSQEWENHHLRHISHVCGFFFNLK